MTVIQINIKEADKEKHSDNQDMKRDDKEEVLMMKNDKNNKYSEATKIINKKRN